MRHKKHYYKYYGSAFYLLAMLDNCVINYKKIGYNIGINYTSPYYIERIIYIMQKVDIKAIVKNLNKEELRDLVSIAQGVLSALFSSDEIKDNIKESRFSKGYECPKCQCKDVNKNGKTRGRQRYICKRCRCTFDEFTMSPFSSR